MLGRRGGGGMEKLRVGLIFGGRSVEHEVSIASATSIQRALDPARYEVTLVAIDHDGRWHRGSPALPPEASVRGELVNLPAAPGSHALVPTASAAGGPTSDLDVIFPIVHGRGGEDGALQGLLELAGIPYVGSGVLGSALQMDKEVSKRLLHAGGVPVTPWVLVREVELRRDPRAAAERALREIPTPLFVKPANQGSSVGISRVDDPALLEAALLEAVRFDTKILIEPAIDAREIEVALLGSDRLEASLPGEIRTRHEFYDYEAKYVDEDTELIIPADLDDRQVRSAQRLAIRAGEILECEGLGRVDFLMDRATGELHVNEVNSLPGFTEVSMYPKLWEAVAGEG
ncbi:MAG: D-alanine--D-alanine ligase, partial [Myxococcales bacterium]